MTKEEILKRAIEKAVKNGLKSDMVYAVVDRDDHSKIIDYGYDSIGYSEKDIIFSHDFAKAFFGREKKPECLFCKQGNTNHTCDSVEGWKFQIQQMVLEEDPIKYLEKYL